MKRIIESREKTMIASIFLSMFGPVVTFIAMMMNDSSTQTADFIRRSMELTMLIISYLMYRYIMIKNLSHDSIRHLEQIVTKLVSFVMFLSGFVLLYISVDKYLNQTYPEQRVYLGFSIAFIAMIVNGYLWFRYVRFNTEEKNGIMHAQSRLYQVKTIMDMVVTITLGVIWIFGSVSISFWFDLVGTVFISIYMFYQGVRTFKSRKMV